MPETPASAAIWWHYTLGTVLFDIIAADGIRRRPRRTTSPGERRAVWFSCRPTWEPSATRAYVAGDARRLATVPEMVAHGAALVRLRVSDHVARHAWSAHRRLGGVDPRVADAIEGAARARGADPDEWRASYHDVPLREILSVDQSSDGETWESAGGTYSSADGGGLDLIPELVERIRRTLGAEP